jgi:uncharacterized protein YdcH (DUF465 family)
MFEGIVIFIIISAATLMVDDKFDENEGVVKTGSIYCVEEIKKDKFKVKDC